jgi:hypothetical protein
MKNREQTRALVAIALQLPDYIAQLQAVKENRKLTYKELFIDRVRYHKRLGSSNGQARIQAKVDVTVLRTLAIGSKSFLTKEIICGEGQQIHRISVLKPTPGRSRYVCKVTAVASRPTSGLVELLAMPARRKLKVEQVQVYSPLQRRFITGKHVVLRKERVVAPEPTSKLAEKPSACGFMTPEQRKTAMQATRARYPHMFS